MELIILLPHSPECWDSSAYQHTQYNISGGTPTMWCFSPTKVAQLLKGTITVIVIFFHLFVGQNKIKTTVFTQVLTRAPETYCGLFLNPMGSRAVGNHYIRNAVDRRRGHFLTSIPGGANARGKKVGTVSPQRRDQNPWPFSHSGCIYKANQRRHGPGDSTTRYRTVPASAGWPTPSLSRAVFIIWSPSKSV